VAGPYEHGNEALSFINGREFLDQLSILLASQGLCCMELVMCGMLFMSQL
jgi:hypothetical protein